MIKIEATMDSIGNWQGQEDNVLHNLNRVRVEIYNRIQGYTQDYDIEQAFKAAWDLWGSDDTLMGELSDADIQRMADRIA